MIGLKRAKEVFTGLACATITIIAVVFSLPQLQLSFAINTEEGSVPSVMNSFRAVYVTTPNIEVAKKIAHGLVSSKLAACVNIIPQITSVYEWEGKVNEDSELLLMIKTESTKFEAIDKFVRENHPYDTPEVISVPIEQGSEKYLKWIKDTIGQTSE